MNAAFPLALIPPGIQDDTVVQAQAHIVAA